MNRSKIMLIIQVVLMYLLHSPFYIVLVLTKIPDIDENILYGFTIAGLICLLLIIPLCFISALVAITGVAGNVAKPYKFSMIIKLTLIPWYVLNILVCVMLFAGFLNPFLILTVPLIIFIEIAVTYMLMLSTSLHSLVYIGRHIYKTKESASTVTVFGIIFLFFFVLDVVGAIMLYFEDKKYGNVLN